MCAILVEGIMRNTLVCKIILNLVQWFSRCGLKLYLIKSSRGEQNHLCDFGRGHHEEHFCEIILNLDQWFRRCHLKGFFYLELWESSDSMEHNHCVILVEGIMGNIPAKRF